LGIIDLVSDVSGAIIAVEERMMASIAAAEPTPEETAELEVAIAQMIAEMDERRLLMEQDQAEIERLKADTERIKMETRALKEESRAIQGDTRRLLDALLAA
jgi:hypothetical protein